jgi:hypothetical protein
MMTGRQDVLPAIDVGYPRTCDIYAVLDPAAGHRRRRR